MTISFAFDSQAASQPKVLTDSTMFCARRVRRAVQDEAGHYAYAIALR